MTVLRPLAETKPPKRLVPPTSEPAPAARGMVVSDLDGLMAFSEFDATYLHQMNKRNRHGQGGSQ